MKVKLIKNVLENGTLKTSRRKNRNWSPPAKQEDGSFLESEEDEFVFTAFTKGTVIEMSDASAEKYIENGLAEPHEEEENEDEQPERKEKPRARGTERHGKAKSRHAHKGADKD